MTFTALSRTCRRAANIVAFALSALILNTAFAQPEPDAAQDVDATPIVAARVNGRAITANQVEREIKAALGSRTVSDDALPRLRHETLLQMIDRQLVLLYLDGRQMAATDEDVTLAMNRLEDELQKRQRTLDDYCRQVGLSTDELRESFRWSLSWRQFLDRYMVDANLEKYFQSHRREFDGSRLKVAHILLKAGGDAAEQWNAAEQRAMQIRSDIESGKLSFADAARQHSAAPTGENGGEIGWIERHEPMPESFSKAAFQLMAGELSKPIRSPFGVHLILCQEIEEGTRNWQEARRDLEPAVAQFLFQWAADQHRSSAQIERTDAIPVVE